MQELFRMNAHGDTWQEPELFDQPDALTFERARERHIDALHERRRAETRANLMRAEADEIEAAAQRTVIEAAEVCHRFDPNYLAKIGRDGLPVQGCHKCDCADPTALDGLADECECECHA